ncbi:MAG: DUF6067 family protein [Fimbriimonas sp.]|nr:DUF6067 family protein [Fimbriimonas sp.]
MRVAGAANAHSTLLEDLPRGIGSWDSKTLGNHRIVIQADSAESAVRVRIPWRRRDREPQSIDVVVTDAEDNRVRNVHRRIIQREFGELAFEPTAGAGTYFAYHLPHVTHGTYYPSVEYTQPSADANPEWVRDVLGSPWEELPEATAVRFESVSEFDAFTPMEIIATPDEVEALLRLHPQSPFLVFPEDRHLSIRMWEDLPYRWAKRGANTKFEGTARRGEYYALQLGVWAARTELRSVAIRFTDLRSTNGTLISRKGITCFNTSGVDYLGEAFSIELDVPPGRVQPLWCGIDIPEETIPGTYSGSATVSAAGLRVVRIPVEITVVLEVAEDRGDDRPEDMTRLRWLNSCLGHEPAIVRPFQASGPIDCRTELDPGGFFAQVSRSSGVKLLAEPIRLLVSDCTGVLPETVIRKPRKQNRGAAGTVWSQESQIGSMSKRLDASLQPDGTTDFRVVLECSEDCEIEDVRLEIPLRKQFAKYLMGLGQDGGWAPESLDWLWDVRKNQEGAWVGSPECGIMFALRDESYVRPLNTNFYHEMPLRLPDSWDNEGKGGIRIRTDGEAYRITGYSGSRRLKKGDRLQFHVHTMLTPFKPLDTRRQFSERYYHAYKPIDEVRTDGANVVNVHHATAINPWINYPFLGLEVGPAAEMKRYIEGAHRYGVRVKIYNTIRELTNRTPELFMLRSLGHEVFSAGNGGGGSWLREHLDQDYIAAWHATEVGDAAIIDSGMSRWHNYYVEGLDWLARKVGIDGLYLDDVAFDRTTMLRVRRVLERRIAERGAERLPSIDLHSANQHNEQDGWSNSSVLYMDLMPYVDRLWFGEYFQYDKGPDYWLTEVSGIPFGLMGEMLQDGGNQWRGMLFGMTARRPWAGDPRPIWRLWDAFGIADSEMIGWWNDRCPVCTGNPEVPATVYVRQDPRPSALIAIASWAENITDVILEIDWQRLGIDPGRATLEAEEVEGFQSAGRFEPTDPISVAPGQGWLLTLTDSI